MSLFGQSSASPFSTASQSQSSPSLFAQSSNTNANKLSLFAQPQQSPSLFGQTSNAQNTGGIFGTSNTSASTTQAQQTSIFGKPLGGTQQLGGGLFGQTSQPQQQSSSLFGTAQTQPQPQQQQGTSIFGGLPNNNQQQQGGGLFGGLNAGNQQQQAQPNSSGLFGAIGASSNQTQQQPQQQQQQQQQQGAWLFQGFNPSTQQSVQNQQQGSLLSQSQSRLFSDVNLASRSKSIPDQIELAYSKWNPDFPISPFRTYLYNTVDPATAPFYGPGPNDDEAKWEEALRKKPAPGSIPLLTCGFYQLGQRMLLQQQCLQILQGRLHEINDGLTALLRKHDLEISIRATECKRKHLRLSQQCLKVAATVQVLRNRGYAMDSREEELREKLRALERDVIDPRLVGRGEEIWARMVNVRERGRMLQRELERIGGGASKGEEEKGKIPEEILERAQKILEDYNAQIEHLAKELAQIQNEYTEWEAGKPK